MKEHKLHLFSARCSSNLFGANTLRFYLSTFAMVLFRGLREAMHGTRLAVASAERIWSEACRNGKVRGARREEMDIEGRERRIPAEPRRTGSTGFRSVGGDWR